MVILFDGERRHNYERIEDGIAPTVLAKFGTGGDTPIVLIDGEKDEGVLCGKRTATPDEHGYGHEHAGLHA